MTKILLGISLCLWAIILYNGIDGYIYILHQNGRYGDRHSQFILYVIIPSCVLIASAGALLASSKFSYKVIPRIVAAVCLVLIFPYLILSRGGV
jgi:hypothetical protein